MKLHYDAATDSLDIDLADRPGVDSLPSKVETIAAA